jgi:hypothetical protein
LCRGCSGSRSSSSSTMFSLKDVVIFFIFPLLNFVLWFKMGHRSIILEASNNCMQHTELSAAAAAATASRLMSSSTKRRSSATSSKGRAASSREYLTFDPPEILDVDSKSFSAYSEESLVEMFFPGSTRTLLVNHHDVPCTSYVNPVTSLKQECLAVAISDSKSSSLDTRFNGAGKSRPVVIDGTSL